MTNRTAGQLEKRDGVGVTVAVLASELGATRDETEAAIETLYRERRVLIRMDEAGITTYRWKEGDTFERRCLCGHPWSHHEGTPGTECIAERCNCGLFREDTNETETCNMAKEKELERGMDRDLALEYMDVLLATKIVMRNFTGRMGYGRVPEKTLEFESGKPDKKERCLELLYYQKRCIATLIEEIENREDEQPQRAADPDQTDIEDVLDSPPNNAVIVWHPGTKDEQPEVVAVTEIEENVYLVRHLDGGKSETLFWGSSWSDLVDQVLGKGHRLEPHDEAEAAAPADPKAPSSTAAPTPAGAK